MNLSSSLRALAFASVCALPLPAGVLTFNFTETGGNVVVTASGSITDVSVWEPRANPSLASSIKATAGEIYFGDAYNTAVQVYTLYSSYTGSLTGSFGSGGDRCPSSTSPSSHLLGINSSELYLPSTYVIGPTSTALSSTMTFTLASFNSLGITPVAQSAVFGGDTIKLTFGSGGGSSVPDAGPGPALALLLGGLGLRQWRSSRRARAAA
jgi:hypothetical protein